MPLPPSASVAPPAAGSLGGRALRALGWGYGGTAIRLALQLAAQAVLARLLGAESFGVFAALMLLSAAAVLASDWVSAALIRAEHIEPELLGFAFTCQLGSSLLVGALVLAALPLYLYLFPGVHGLSVAVALMALGCSLTGLAGVSMSLLRRELAFREIQAAQVLGYAIGYGLVAIPMAMSSAHAALVLPAAWCVQSLVTSTLLYRAWPHPLRLRFRHREQGPFMRFSLQVTLGNLANWLGGSADKLIVAQACPAATIGHYNVTMNLLMTPVTQLGATVNTIAFSVSPRQDERARGPAALAYIGLTAWVAALLYAALATFPASLVTAIYGERWHGAAVFVEPFAVVAVAVAVGAAANSILTAAGEAGRSALVQMIGAAAVFGVFIPLARSELGLAVACMAGVFVVRAVVLSFFAARRFDPSLLRLAGLLATPLALGLVQLAVGRLVANAMDLRGAASHLLLGASVAIVFAAGGIALRRLLFPRAVAQAIDSLLHAFSRAFTDRRGTRGAD